MPEARPGAIPPRKYCQQDAKQHPAKMPVGRRQVRGFAGHIGFKRIAHRLQKLSQLVALQCVKLRLAANAGHGEALAQPPFEAIATVLDHLDQHVDDPARIRPRKLVTGLQKRWGALSADRPT